MRVDRGPKAFESDPQAVSQFASSLVGRDQSSELNRANLVRYRRNSSEAPGTPLIARISATT